MSEPSDTPGVKKTTRRFAPVKRGGKSPAAQRRAAEAAAAAAAATATATASASASAETEASGSSVKLEASESANTSAETEAHASSVKASSIGTIRPEGSGSGRLQSVNDGQKTRGGTMKMKFKPTVPHKRNKKEVSSSTIDEALGHHPGGERGGRGGGRGGRGRGGRGRGRGRGGLVIVDESTASGIFSLGPSAISRGRPGFGGGGGAFASFGGDVPTRAEGDDANTDMVEMFTCSVGNDTPVTFRHISRLEGDIDPVTLKQTVGKIPWMTVKSQKKKSVVESDDQVKVEALSDMDDDDGADVVASKVLDTIDSLIDIDQEEERQEQEQELPKVYMDGDSPAQNIFALDEKQRVVCVAEEELLYFQLPTVVPIFEKPKLDETGDVVMDDDVEIKPEATITENPLPAAAKTSGSLEQAMANMALEDMPEGQVGKLIIYKSGKVKMQFGSILLDVNQGMQSTFLENIMVVDHESEDSKKAIELGHIVQKFVCAPNMDALLSEALN